MLDLLDAFGGVRIEVPVRPGASTQLARAVGLPAARILCREFGGSRLNVPLARRWRAMRLRAAGLPYTAIARRLGMTESGVFRILSDGGMTGQMNLPLDAPLPPQG